MIAQPLIDHDQQLAALWLQYTRGLISPVAYMHQRLRLILEMEDAQQTPLGEILAAARDTRAAWLQSLGDPRPQSRHAVWHFMSPQGQLVSCFVHCFLGPDALITDDAGNTTWRKTEGLFEGPDPTT